MISEKLQGLVFIPDFYYQGIEAMAANTFYYKALTLPTVNANDDFSTDKATEGKTFSLTPEFSCKLPPESFKCCCQRSEKREHVLHR